MINLILAGSFNLLAVNPGLLFWTVITFLTVLFVLWLFAWKPLIRAIDKRNDRIQDDLQNSETLRKDAETLLKKYEAMLAESKVESAAIIKKSRETAEQERQQILKDAAKECSELQQKVNEEIELAKETFLTDMKGMVIDMTTTLVGKLFEKKMDVGQHQNFIEQEFNNLLKREATNK